jgi:hypothetical protein
MPEPTTNQKINPVFLLYSYVDPTLEQDLQSNSKPWALSPLISTMTHFAHSTASSLPTDSAHKAPNFPPSEPIADNTSRLPFQPNDARPAQLPAGSPGSAEARRAFFKTAEHRKLVTFGPDVRITRFAKFP